MTIFYLLLALAIAAVILGVLMRHDLDGQPDGEPLPVPEALDDLANWGEWERELEPATQEQLERLVRDVAPEVAQGDAGLTRILRRLGMVG